MKLTGYNTLNERQHVSHIQVNPILVGSSTTCTPADHSRQNKTTVLFLTGQGAATITITRVFTTLWKAGAKISLVYPTPVGNIAVTDFFGHQVNFHFSKNFRISRSILLLFSPSGGKTGFTS